MELREVINKNPAIVIGVVVLAILVAGAVIYLQSVKTGLQKFAYFSVDDGKTWFADDVDKNAPFMHEGKEAYKAYVFKCDGKTYVAMLEKYTPEFKAKMDQAVADRKAGKQGSEPMDNPSNHLWKKPGENRWLAGFEADRILSKADKCSDGQLAESINP